MVAEVSQGEARSTPLLRLHTQEMPGTPSSQDSSTEGRATCWGGLACQTINWSFSLRPTTRAGHLGTQATKTYPPPRSRCHTFQGPDELLAD